MRIADLLHARLAAQPHVTASRALRGCWVSAPRTVPGDLLHDRLLLMRVAHLAVSLSRTVRTIRSPSHTHRSASLDVQLSHIGGRCEEPMEKHPGARQERRGLEWSSWSGSYD